ncbi:MAG: hypothetical protein ABS76_23270 [Pelagibacterium sp. SCN 64-44]|nr:MAG: hypothetical protein ABS76_23270 [Pelagibacterium sp. SCN 64-44]
MSETGFGQAEKKSAFERGLIAVLLALGLVLASVAGILISYLLLVLALLAIAYFALREPRWPWRLDTMGLVFLGSFGLLTLTFAVSARTPADLRFALNFLAFPLYIPLATLLGRAAFPKATQWVAWLAFAGAVLGASYAVGEVLLTGAYRAGTWAQTDPIRLANTTLLLGFLALIGFRQQIGRWRYLLLTGPFLGLAAVLACGARNAMVAFAVLLGWASMSLIKGWKWRLLAVLVLVAALLVVLSVDSLQPARLSSLIATIKQMLSGQDIVDRSFDIRLELYRSALSAFGEAPIFGHGWHGMMRAIAPYLPEIYADQVSLPHLHNEVLNFAIASGAIGIAVLIALLAAPIVIALRSPADSQKGARILGCSLILIGYLVMGLADTMISYETHTALYVLWTAILLAYCRDEAETSSSNTGRSG